MDLDSDELVMLVVLGHSWGGMVVAGLPASGTRPRTLVLLDPPYLDHHELVAMTLTDGALVRVGR